MTNPSPAPQTFANLPFRSLAIAYCLLFFFGWTGSHRVYVRKLKSGVAMLGLGLFILLLVRSGPGRFIAIPFALAYFGWWLADAVRLAGWVIDRHNEEKRLDSAPAGSDAGKASS